MQPFVTGGSDLFKIHQCLDQNFIFLSIFNLPKIVITWFLWYCLVCVFDIYLKGKVFRSSSLTIGWARLKLGPGNPAGSPLGWQGHKQSSHPWLFSWVCK